MHCAVFKNHDGGYVKFIQQEFLMYGLIRGVEQYVLAVASLVFSLLAPVWPLVW